MGGKLLCFGLFFSERLRRHRQPSKCCNKDMPLAKVINCWIKDKDMDKARILSSVVAHANLCCFHPREIPGVWELSCIWQVSFQLGWKPSPSGAASLIHPTPDSLSQLQTHSGVLWRPKRLLGLLGPHQNPCQGFVSKGSAGRTWDLLCSLPDLQGKSPGYIRDHQKMNLWGMSVLCLASNAPKGAWRKFWHLPTCSTQILQSLFPADPAIHSFQGCFLWSCSSASHWRQKVERSQWIIRSPTAGLSKWLLLIFPLLLSFCSACNKSLCPLLFKL